MKTQLQFRTKYLLNTCTTFFNLGLAAITNLISAPISLTTWGTEGFGLVILTTALNGYITLIAFGQHQAAEVLGTMEPDSAKKRQYFLTSLGFMAFSALVVFAAVLSLAYLQPSIMLRGLSFLLPQIQPSLLFPLTYYICFTALSTVFLLATSLLRAEQCAYVDNIITGLNAPLGLALLLFAKYCKLPLQTYLPLLGIIPLILGIFKAILAFVLSENTPLSWRESLSQTVFFWRSPSFLRQTAAAQRLLMVAFAGLLVWNTDSFLVSHALGSESLVSYSITFRVFSIAFTVLAVFSQSLLPLMGKAFGQQDWSFLERTYSRAVRLLLLCGGGIWVSSAFFMRPFVHFWVGPKGDAGLDAVILFGAYAYVLSIVNIHASLLTTFNFLKGTPFLAYAEAAIKVTAALLLMRTLGVAGNAAAMLLGCSLVPMWLCPLLLSKRSQSRLQFCWGDATKHFLGSVLPPILVARFLPPVSLATWIVAIVATIVYYPLTAILVLRLKPLAVNLIEPLRLRKNDVFRKRNCSASP